MSSEYPSFKATAGGCAILAVPFLWFFDWKPWAWAVAGIFCVFMCCSWLSEALKVYRAEQSGSGSASPVRRSQPSRQSGDDDDVLAGGKVMWEGSREIRFAYTSFESGATDREVTVSKVVRKGRTNADTYFLGFCHLRNEPRTFRLDRIKGQVTDTATGEMATFRQLFDLRAK